MGSASREALNEASTALSAAYAAGAELDLLNAAQVLAENQQLAQTLADPTVADAEKQSLVARLFSACTESAQRVLTTAAQLRWSTHEEFVAGIEELGIRAAAISNPDIDQELLAIAEVVNSHHELELTLSSKLHQASEKQRVVAELLGSKVSDSALAVVQQLIADPRGRRLGAALQQAAETTADQAGYTLATVTLAGQIDQQRQERLQRALSSIAQRPVKLTTVIDPDLVGGVRVQLGDEIIDGSVRSRLEDLRLQLAG